MHTDNTLIPDLQDRALAVISDVMLTARQCPEAQLDGLLLTLFDWYLHLATAVDASDAEQGYREFIAFAYRVGLQIKQEACRVHAPSKVVRQLH
ncbi:hypothetical protein [Deinococcus sonorensis]|uniref:Uncharacterized protein n=2 Tax=Deinococcus sonorensis TaxID=309891 RepID=A0AAU7U7E7_9DEIO